jgi:Icc-related predicted phosphoesterase
MASKKKDGKKASARPDTHVKNRRHVFGRRRPEDVAGGPQLHTKTPKEHRDQHYRDFDPLSDGACQLDLAKIISADDYDTIKKKKKLTFHLNGDMGGIKTGIDQELVAKGMEGDFDKTANASENPSFLYIVGDCVYYNGSVKEYYAQFYEPYEYYPAPIFAVPGNHDGENLPGESSLDGFIRNFCQNQPGVVQPESGTTGRTAMVQPNVYWTLLTPLVNIVGLYSNVPPGGDIREPQRSWLVKQLQTLSTDVPLLVSLHQPVYSADTFHGGSTRIKEIIEEAAAEAKREPDMVLTGHVHNYQRFTRPLDGKLEQPHLVTGAGGYSNLHSIISVNDDKLIAPTMFKDKGGEEVRLDRYSDDRHGFMRIEVDEDLITGRYYTVPRPQEPFSKPSQLTDYFQFSWKERRVLPNTLE